MSVRLYTEKKKKRVVSLPPSSGMHHGSLLLEAILAIAIFAVFLGGIGLSLVLGERSTTAGGDRTRAAFLAEQQLEAVRQMRTVSFASVTTGDHGLKLNASGWSWSGTLVNNNGYTSWVTVTSKGTDWLEVESNVTWNFGNTRSGSVLLTTQLTDWQKIATVGNWASMTKIAESTISGSPDFHSIAISGMFAYVTSTQAPGDTGLYIFNVSNPASPVRVASSFDLGASAYGITAVDNRLYIATNDTTKEVQVYDITDPTNLTTGNLINSFDLAGDGKARSIAIYGSHVFVGALDDAINDQLTAVQMSETNPMTLLSSLNVSGSVLGLALQNGYAYLANSYNVGEFHVVDIFDPENMVFAPGVGIDMPDTQDGNVMAISGTSALIGRLQGSTISELTLYDIGLSPVPSPPPGPWTLETDGDIRTIATIYGNKYAFIGGSMTSNQIRVLDLIQFAQGAGPVVKNYDTESTIHGLVYDWQTDRMFAISSSSLYVFAPG